MSIGGSGIPEWEGCAFSRILDSCNLEVCLGLLGLSLLQNPGAVRVLTRKQTLHKARINADTQWSYRVTSLSTSRVPPLGTTKRPEIGLLKVAGALERAAASSGSRTRSWCEVQHAPLFALLRTPLNAPRQQAGCTHRLVLAAAPTGNRTRWQSEHATCFRRGAA